MSLDNFVLLVIACLAVNLSPGPSVMLVSSVSAARGFRAGLYAVLGMSAGAMVHVLLAAIIPVNHAVANERIAIFNSLLHELALELDSDDSRIILVDQFEGFDAALDTYDGLHPNENGIIKMAAIWMVALSELLQ